MKTGKLNWTPFAKLARKAMYLLAFAVFGAQAATVAKVGDVGYETLDAALAEVAEGKPLTWVSEAAWPLETPVYYNGTFYEPETVNYAQKGALEVAIDAANEANAEEVAKIYVRPGFDADKLVLQSHQPMKTSLAIYGNDAKLSRNWEPCVEYPGASGDSGAHQLTKDVSLAIFNLHNGAGFWGRRATDYTVGLKLSGCQNAHQIMFYGSADTSVKGKTNISVAGCTFDAADKNDHNVIVSIGAGTVEVADTTFTAANINIKNVDGGDNTISVKDCTFKDTVAGNQNIRVRSYVEGSQAKLTVENVTFEGASTQNIEIGDSKADSKGDVSYTISKTTGTLNIYKQGATAAETTALLASAETPYTGGNVAEKAVDFATFVAALEDANYTFDGSTHALAQDGKLTVKWSPKSGCYDTRAGHDCTVGNVLATANTPKRVNSGLTQFQLFEGESRAVSVKNVAFVYEPAAFTVCENSDWRGSFTAEQAPAGQIYLMNTGDVAFEGCTFDKVVLTSFNCTGTSTVKDCSFKNVYNSYAVKDIRGVKVSVTDCAFEDCGAAVMVSSTGGKVEAVTVCGNTFKNVDVADTAAEGKVGTRGLIQIAAGGDYSGTAFDFSDNTATACGPVMRQLNTTVSFDTTDKSNLNKLVSEGASLYTDDTFVAQVGETKYATLAEAFAALSAENRTLALLPKKGAFWDAAKPVYWAAGAQSGYAATLAAALTAAYKAGAGAGAITVVCRPGADVGKMTHGHVADDLTIYGNNAYISDGECDLEVDTFKFSRATGAQADDGVTLDKDITITAYELDNLGVWGQRTTAHKVTVNLTDCDGKALEGKTNVQRVYLSGAKGVNDITLTDCDFITKATAVYSNADGAIKAVNCSFTGGQLPFNINHKADGAQTVEIEGCTFKGCGDTGEWEQFAAPIRFVNSGAGTLSASVTKTTITGTVGANGDILLGDGRTGQKSNDVALKVVDTAANVQAQKPGYYGETVDETKKATATSPASGTLETSVAKLLPVNDGSKAHPYSREQFAAMTRADYIKAQERLDGTLYVDVGDYTYEKNGVLGNGERNDATGQTPDHSKLNAYGENGYLGEQNDGANGHTVVFVGGTITSGVKGYTSIDSIGTSLLLAVPAYTKVKFEKTTFNNVLSFDYQLYTVPWSQLGGLAFEGCTFNGIIVGAIASQEIAFTGCAFKNYVNTASANNSNPTWIRPAYGNWSKGDNEGQGGDFRSLTKITFENNTVTSTRPVKFERIAQWGMATTVTATGNTFDITPQEGDTSTKNVGLYFGANAKFDLVVDDNKRSDKTAALYTAVYSASNGGNYAGLPAGSTVKNKAGEDVASEDAFAWKTTDTLTLKTTGEVASVTNAKGVSVNFATLAAAIAAAKDGETVKLLMDTNGDGIAIAPNTFKTGLTVDFGGHTYTVGGLLVGSSGTASNGFQLNAGNRITFRSGAIVGATATAGAGTDWKGAPAILIQNYCDLTLEEMTVKGGDETCYTLSNNNGEIVIEDSTIVAGQAKGTIYSPVAFDVCRYASYPSVHVTVRGSSVIEGDVEVSGTIGDGQSRQLDIEGGTFKGAFTVVNQPANIAIAGGTFSTAVDEAYCASGYIPTANDDGTYGVKAGAYVAQVGTTKYETLAEAIAAAKSGDTITLLADVVNTDYTVANAVDIKLASGVTLDGNGKTIRGNVKVTVVSEGDVTIKNANFKDIHNAADVSDAYKEKYGFSDDKVGTLSAIYAPKLAGALTISGCTFENSDWEAMQITPAEGAKIDIRDNVFKTSKSDVVKEQLRHVHVEMAYGSGFDYEGTDIKLTITDNQFLGETKEANMGVWWVGKSSTLDVSGNYYANPDAVSITLSDKSGKRENRCDLIYPARSVADENVDNLKAVALAVKDAFNATAHQTFEAAVAAADAGATVKMLADVVLTEKQTISKTITLDLNGKTISSTVNQFITIAKGGDLTVNDATGEGRIENTTTGSWGGTIVMTGGVLTVNGGTIAANSATSEYSPTIEADTSSAATISVAGGRIEADRTGNARAINLKSQANVTLNVTGGEIVGSRNGIYSFAGNTINISAGVVAGKAGSAVYSSGKNWVLISGGTLRPGGTASALYISMGSQATVTVGREDGTVDDVTIPSIDVGNCKTTVNLLSGMVKAFKNWSSMTVEKVSQGKDKLLVGTDISKCLPGNDLLCQLDAGSGLYEIVKLTVENAAAIVTHNGEETPYHTVEQARKAVTDGDTLTLKVDHTGALALSAKNVTVDLGGHTLTYSGTGEGAALQVNQGAGADNTVTVRNGTIKATGQNNACIRATSGTVAQTLTLILGGDLTLTVGSNNRSGKVVLDKGARTVSPCAAVNNGGLLVTEGEKRWIYGETETAFTRANGSEVTLLNDWYCTDTKGAVKVPETCAFASAKLNLGGRTIKHHGVGPAIVMSDAANPSEGTTAKTLEVSNGTIETPSHGAAVCGSNNSLTLDRVTLKTTGDGKLGVYANGMTRGNTVALKNGSAVVSEKATGIYFPGAGTLTVEDSNVTGGMSGIEVRAGVLNVSGMSVIASTAAAFSFKNDGNGITTTGASVAAVKHTVGNDLAVTITGGTFKGPRGFYANDPNTDKEGTVTVSISGGAFSTDVEKDYLADGCKTVQQTIDGVLYYVVGPAVTQIEVSLGDVKKPLPFADAWLVANIGADASGWTTTALEAPAKNGLATWQCYLFGLDPANADAKIVATAKQGTAEEIPLTVANADAATSPLVKEGLVTVLYVLMGSDDNKTWTKQVAEATTPDGLAIPLTGTTYKFYRVDVKVTSAESAEGN